MVMWSLRWSENNFSFKISQLAYVWIELKSVFSCVMCFLMGPVHRSRDPQVLYLAKKNFNTRSYGTIHTFKNYFATIFAVFSNKRYLNRPFVLISMRDWAQKVRTSPLNQNPK